MSFLDDQKRARKGAKSLVRLLTQEGRFDANLDEYAKNDGIIDDDFLRQLDETRPMLSRADAPEFAGLLEKLPVAFQEALLEYLTQKNRYDVIRGIVEKSRAKALVKSAKQLLHIAKAAGAYNPEQKSGSWKIAVDEEALDLSCVILPYDHNGERFVVVGKEHPSGVRFLHVLENDRTGVIDHNSGVIPRSAYRKMLRDLRETGGALCRDVSIEEALWRIDRAVRRHERDQSTMPAGLLTALSQFPERSSANGNHPFLARVRPVELEHQEKRASASRDLFEHPIAAAWSIGSMEFRRFQHRLSEHAKTREDLFTPSVRDRVSELIDETVTEYFDPRAREGFEDRLLDLAWFIVDENRDLALLAYGTAKALRDPARTPLSIPFCRALLSRFVPGQNEVTPPADKPLIVAP